MIIESAQNKIIKTVNSLADKKHRDATGMFLVEGQKFVDEIPDDWQVQMYVVSESYHNSIFTSAPVYTVADSLYNKISGVVTPQGVMAVVSKKKHYVISYHQKSLFLVVDGVSDPGNLGTIIRTADAFAVDALLVSDTSVDIYNPKVLRSTMGSIFHLPVLSGLDIREACQDMINNGVNLICTSLSATKPPTEINMQKPTAIVIGNEAHGVSQSLGSMATQSVKIPMPGRSESLNASISCSILLYEATRQRG